MLKNLDITGISVVIVTYNGKDRIKNTLRHLGNQSGIDFPIELVIIDNKSTDQTTQVAEDLWSQLGSPYPLRIISEDRAGTMYARQRGIAEASYRYLLYCDDDNWFASDYIALSYKLISRNHQIAVLGGRGKLVFDEGFQIPEWLSEVSNYYGSGPQGKQAGDTTYDKGCLYTAGATLDRVWLNKLYETGFQFVLTGRQGNSLIAGEDTELTYALAIIGGALHYSDKLLFSHYMLPRRITWDYFLKLSYAFGYSNFILKKYRRQRKHSFLANQLLSILLMAKYYLLYRLKGRREGDINASFFYKFKGQFDSIAKARVSDIGIDQFLKANQKSKS